MCVYCKNGVRQWVNENGGVKGKWVWVSNQPREVEGCNRGREGGV